MTFKDSKIQMMSPPETHNSKNPKSASEITPMFALQEIKKYWCGRNLGLEILSAGFGFNRTFTVEDMVKAAIINGERGTDDLLSKFALAIVYILGQAENHTNDSLKDIANEAFDITGLPFSCTKSLDLIFKE